MSDNMRRVRLGILTHETGLQFETVADNPTGTHYLVPVDEIERLRGVINEREHLLFDWLENGDAAGPNSPMERTLFLFEKIGGEDECHRSI